MAKKEPQKMDMKKIYIWNRLKHCEELESVYGDASLQILYGTKWGQFLMKTVFSRPIFSQVAGLLQSSPQSQSRIEPFIRKFEIPMQEFEPGPYSTFNEFFIRKFKPEMRSFTAIAHEMPAFAEARYYAYRALGKDQALPVKGVRISPAALLGGADQARDFEGGPCLLARLCPVDYHRFHFPDSGTVTQAYRIHGRLHSVNPIALQYQSDILMTNERQVSVLETEHFGKLAYVEVGAMCVGHIVQTAPAMRVLGQCFQRGEEKGYFLFGGSTVILLGEPGRWVPDEDLLTQTDVGRETRIRLGERIAMQANG